MCTIEIRDESIRLGQLLKLANFAQDGSEAKVLLRNGEVFVNGQVQLARGKQIYGDDFVEVGKKRVTVKTKKGHTKIV